MLKSAEFMSLKAFKTLAPSAGVAVISIRDSSSIRDLPSFCGFWGVLPLNMLDVCEENARQAPGAWADEPTREQHFKYCEIPDNCAPSLSHAHAIRDFVCQLHECEDELELVVHCSAGVSRSAAVAWWASERFGASLRDSASVGLGEANPRILRLLKSLV
jgi:predicted protein tyrosine phosphatase